MNKKDEDNSIIVLGAISATSSYYLLGLFEIGGEVRPKFSLGCRLVPAASACTLGLMIQVQVQAFVA